MSVAASLDPALAASSSFGRWEHRGFETFDLFEAPPEEPRSLRHLAIASASAHAAGNISSLLGAAIGALVASAVIGEVAGSIARGGFDPAHPRLASSRSAVARPALDPWRDLIDTLAGPAVGLGERQLAALREHLTWIRAAVGPRLPLPQAEAGEDEAVRLAWSREAFYAELEINPDGTHEWFFRDRRADTHDGSEGAERGAPSRRFYSRLGNAVRG